MRDLDEADRTILRLLLEDGRRPYSDLADHVDLSPPAVADRISRLESLGVVRRFTVDVDTSKLYDGVGVLVDLVVRPGATDAVADALADHERVEHRYVTADAHVVVHATLGPDGVDGLLSAVDSDALHGIEVRLLSDATWHPRLGEATLAIDCVECGNRVGPDGESAVIDDTEYHFCCGSCLANFEDRFDELSEAA